MFGTLKPRRCSLDEASQREHDGESTSATVTV